MNAKSSKQTKQNQKVITTSIGSPKVDIKGVEPASSNNKKKALTDTALNLAKQFAPDLLSMIPGVGAILGPASKAILSTMNDDEWFEEFTPAGATFSEILTAKMIGDSNNQTAVIDILPSLVQIDTSFNGNDKIKEAVFPSILAYLRSKTNNVLIPEVDEYWKAFVETVNLYSLYFTIRKYNELSLNIPVNVNNIGQVVNAINPAYLSDLRGIADSLQAYLNQTSGIPHALCEYLRWRFGTIFLSDNTGKPALITYDFKQDKRDVDRHTIDWIAGDVVNDIKTYITEAQLILSTAGRATADLHLAYADHEKKMTVEKAHYDEKERCLRMNMTPRGSMYVGSSDVALLMDSRLAQSPGIQAVTISTICSNYDGEYEIGNQIDITGSSSYDSLTVPFYCDHVSVLVRDEQKLFLAMAGASAQTNNYYANEQWLRFIMEGQGNMPLTYTKGSITPTAITTANASTAPFIARVWTRIALIAAQMHHQNVAEEFISGNYNYFLKSNPLSFDRATITKTQLEAIQVMALRNLVRGTYKRKAVKAENAETVKIEEKLVEQINPTVSVKV